MTDSCVHSDQSDFDAVRGDLYGTPVEWPGRQPMGPTGSVTTQGQVGRSRQCPRCGAITDRFEHCHRRPSPMFPQLDESEVTLPVLVTVVDRLCYSPMWVDAERRERPCSRGTKGCNVDHDASDQEHADA